MSYPDDCIRGIPNAEYLIEDGSVATHLFYFKESDCRDDGWKEQSINWKDDESAIDFTLNQTKECGEKQFKMGIAILPRSEIDRISSLPTLQQGLLSYERKEEDNNLYHGNILLKASVPKKTMVKVAAALALHVSAIILQPFCSESDTI